jgi:hypothetical protein
LPLPARAIEDAILNPFETTLRTQVVAAAGRPIEWYRRHARPNLDSTTDHPNGVEQKAAPATRYSRAMKVGVAIGGTLGEVGSLAARAEAAGLESVWVAELDRTALVQAAAAISAALDLGARVVVSRGRRVPAPPGA